MGGQEWWGRHLPRATCNDTVHRTHKKGLLTGSLMLSMLIKQEV